MWTRREASNGLFVEAKTHGGSFKGVPAPQSPLPHAAWWCRLVGIALLAVGFAETYVASTPSLLGIAIGVLGLALIFFGIIRQLLRRA